MISNSLELGGCGEDVAYPLTLIECLFRSPSQLDVRTRGSQQKLTAHFDVYYLARQPSLEEEGKTRKRLPTLSTQLQPEFNFNQRQALCLLKFDRKN